MENEIKRCPFRKASSMMSDEEFAPCYGKECMAYLEYELPGPPIYQQQKIKVCKRMAQPLYYGGGCSLPEDKA